MQTKKMSLENIKGKLSRAEMKNIMAGSGDCQNKDQACSSILHVNCCSGLTCTTEGCKTPNFAEE